MVQFIVQTLAFVVCGYLIFHLGVSWFSSIWSSRVASRALSEVDDAGVFSVGLMPESLYKVHLSDHGVTCDRPDGIQEYVSWMDLQKIEVLTTSDGPLLPDVFWVLHGMNGGCAIPQGATGDSALLERLQMLPGFDDQKFIEAMGSTSDSTFVCWTVPPSS